VEREAEVVVLGAGVAGLAVARALAERGRRVLVVAERLGEARRVPVALVNPVRGKRGVLVPEGAWALEVARAFYTPFAELRFGLLRPVPEAERERWALRLQDLPHAWRREGLFLPTAFWLEPRPLLERLAQGLEVVLGRAVAWDGALHLEDGRRLRPEVLVYAGGAKGAGLFRLGGRFVAGLTLLLEAWVEPALSHRVFLAGNALGGSYLDREGYEEPPPSEGEVEWLLQGAEALLGYRPKVVAAWRGVRLRLPEPLFPIPGGYALAGLGSTGFLLAPLLARRLADKL
jgi:glycine/D-amino acid oxidase-like deaminating enzyme